MDDERCGHNLSVGRGGVEGRD
ncbi:hypothetical protein CDAR_468831, partial [Caerostris darwini]